MQKFIKKISDVSSQEMLVRCCLVWSVKKDLNHKIAQLITLTDHTDCCWGNSGLNTCINCKIIFSIDTGVWE